MARADCEWVQWRERHWWASFVCFSTLIFHVCSGWKPNDRHCAYVFVGKKLKLDESALSESKCIKRIHYWMWIHGHVLRKRSLYLDSHILYTFWFWGKMHMSYTLLTGKFLSSSVQAIALQKNILLWRNFWRTLYDATFSLIFSGFPIYTVAGVQNKSI